MFAVLLILALSALNKEVIANSGIEGSPFILDYPVELMDDYSAKDKRDECSEYLKLDEPSKRTVQMLAEKAKAKKWEYDNPCPAECYPDQPRKESNGKKTKKDYGNKLRTHVPIATQLPLACMRLFNMNTKECQAYFQI